ncbi:MAG TPA: glycosyltransferase family 4 protein [Propionibacteriaceae bacterium]|nr:glycosyltransferase family 4 protein [Propionibacteriaceae bacterium]
MRETVCYVTQVYRPENVGVAIWVAEELERIGWDVTVLTGIPNYPTGVVAEGYRADRASRELIRGIEVRRTPLYPSHDTNPVGRMLNYTSWALSSTYYGLGDIRRAGLAVVHSTPVTANLAPMVARVLFGTPYVTMIMDLWPDSVFQSGFLTSGLVRRVADVVLSAFARWSYRLASHVTVLSPSMKQVLVDRGVPPEKISLVYNWVDESLFAAPAEPDPTLRQELGLTDDDFVAMYAGAHGIAQGLGVLVEAAALLEGSERIHIVTVGDGIDGERLRALAEELGVTDRVHFLGRRPMATMPGLLAAADLQVVCISDTPLFRVNMPSKIPSVLAGGHPLLVVAVGDPADVVTDADAGLSASPNDPADVADALRRAKEAGADMLREMGERGRDLYEREMSAAIGGARLTEILHRAKRKGRS